MSEQDVKNPLQGGQPADNGTPAPTPAAAPAGSTTAHKVATAIGVILCVLLVPILVVNCILLFKGATNQDEVPSVGGVVPFIVLSDSMYPQIQSGDLIICRQADASEVHEGDVISFFDPEGNGTSVVSHRVTAISTDASGELSFTTKGDANNVEDSTPVPANKVIGIYQTRIPGLGNVAMFMQSTQGLIVCVVVPVALLLAYDIIRRRAYDKQSQAETDALKAQLAELQAQTGNANDPSDGEKDKD